MAMALAVAVGVAPERGRAQATAAAPDWLVVSAPDGGECLTARALGARIRHYLRHAPPASLRVVLLRATPPRFVVQDAGRPVAERHFDDLRGTCPARVDAVALSMALALEGAGAGPVVLPAAGAGAVPVSPAESDEPGATDLSGSAGPPAAEEARPGAAAAEQDRVRAVATTLDASRTTTRAVPGARLGLHAGAGVGGGLQPRFAWWSRAGAELDLDRLRLGLAGLLSPSSRSALAAGHVDSTALGAELSGCGPLWRGLAPGALCLHALGGALVARGGGFDATRSTTRGWFSLGAAIGIRYPADTPLAVRLWLRGQLNVVRPALRVDGPAGERIEVPVGAALGLLELHWLLGSTPRDEGS